MDDSTTETAEKTVFEIPATNLPGLLYKVEKLSKKSQKLLGKPIALEMLGEVRKPMLRDGRTVRKLDGSIAQEVFHRVRIDAETPRIAGWTFIATIDHSPASGNLIRIVPNTVKSVPEKYRSIGALCDHCGKLRLRRDTYLLRCDATGELKQVASQCVKDFIGYDPKRVLALAEWLGMAVPSAEDADFDPSERGGSFLTDRRFIFVTTYLAHCAAVIRTFGWKSKKDAEFGSTTSTAHDAFMNMFPPKGASRTDRVELTDRDFALAEAAQAWAKNLAGRSDYEHNLRIAASETMVEYRTTGILASLIPAYHRAREEEIKRAERRQSFKDSQHIGKVGERLRNIEAKLYRVHATEGRFGAVLIYNFVTADGNVLVWFGSRDAEVDQGANVRLTGTVTRHGEYQGVKQTTLSRCKVEAVGGDQ